MDDNLIQKIINTREIKTVQFNLTNNSLNQLDFNLFDASSLNQITNNNNIFQTGEINTSFNIGTGCNNQVTSIAKRNDGKILVGGYFSSFNGVSANYIVGLNSDGSIDNTFVYGTGFDLNGVNNIKIQNDDKILVGGEFNNYNGTSANNIIRLNSDGSVDNTFIYGTGVLGFVNYIDIQSDGKIILTGNILKYNLTNVNRIVRLNTNGSIDNTFSVGTGFNNTTVCSFIQSDNKILVGGFFDSFNGNSLNRIIRLNSNGSLDTSFNIGTGFDNGVNSISVDSNSKIYVSGYFTTYNGTSANYIIKLNSDGSIDSSFDYGTGFDNFVFNVLIQSDGKIICTGLFTNYNGISANRIIRLNSDGSVDTNFNTNLGFNDFSFISVNYNDSILVGGNFTSYNGISAPYLVSLYSTQNTFNVSGSSVDYNYFVQTLNNDPKIICDILIKMPQRYLVNPLNVIYTDANGESTTTPYLPNTDIDVYQKSPNRGSIKFENGLVINVNTQISIIIPPLTTVILLIDYKEFLKSDMLDLIVYRDDGKAKYCISQSLKNGEITANKYWGSKSMPKKIVLNKDWLNDLESKFSKIELLEYDTPKLAGGTNKIRGIYQDLFGFKREIKEKSISITEKGNSKKDFIEKISNNKKTIKPKNKKKIKTDF
jgi:uncharacterized delta-60 repeat protein